MHTRIILPTIVAGILGGANRVLVLLTVVLGALLLRERFNAQQHRSYSVEHAVCVFPPESAVQGHVAFSTKGEGVDITLDIRGLPPGKHGFHIHERGDLRRACNATGGHFNPHGVDHGARVDDARLRHVGDLGNIESSKAGGTLTHTFTDSLVELSSSLRGVLGRAVVIHAGEDDLGSGGHAQSKTTGNAGGRIACCTIAVNGALQQKRK